MILSLSSSLSPFLLFSFFFVALNPFILFFLPSFPSPTLLLPPEGPGLGIERKEKGGGEGEGKRRGEKERGGEERGCRKNHKTRVDGVDNSNLVS